MQDTSQVSQQNEGSPPQPTKPIDSGVFWYQKFGTASQIVSAVVSLLTLVVAIYGLTAAAPFFKNKLLNEQNAELLINIDQNKRELADLSVRLLNTRKLAWFSLCHSIAGRIPYDINPMASNADGTHSMDRFVALNKANYRAGLRYVINHTDIANLLKEDQATFKDFSNSFVTGLPSDFDHPIETRLSFGLEFIPLGVERRLQESFVKSCENALPT